MNELQEATRMRLEAQVESLSATYRARVGRLVGKAPFLVKIDQLEAKFLAAGAEALKIAKRRTAKLDLHPTCYIPINDYALLVSKSANFARAAIRRATGRWNAQQTGDQYDQTHDG